MSIFQARLLSESEEITNSNSVLWLFAIWFVLLVKLEPLFGSHDTLVVSRRYLQSLFLIFDRLSEISCFSVGRGQGVDVTPFFPGRKFTRLMRLFDGFLSIA